MAQRGESKKRSGNFGCITISGGIADYGHKIYATPELKNRYLQVDANTGTIEEQSESLNRNEGGQKDESGGQERWLERVVRLLELIAEKPNITRKELSEALKINPSAVQKHIEKLKNEGIISRVGSDKKGRWKMNDK